MGGERRRTAPLDGGKQYEDERLGETVGRSDRKVTAQLDRASKDHPAERVELKTDESKREVPLVREVVVMLKEHKLGKGLKDPATVHSKPDDYVFATVSGTAVSQRNLLRELDRAQRAAVDSHGEPMFPSAFDENGKPVPRKRANLPTIHGMRHSLASRLVAEGETVDEVAWTLGHKDGRTTRAVYVHELRSAEQRSRRLARAERDVKWMSSSEGNQKESSQSTGNETIVYLSEKRSAAE
jgi:integrase